MPFLRRVLLVPLAYVTPIVVFIRRAIEFMNKTRSTKVYKEKDVPTSAKLIITHVLRIVWESENQVIIWGSNPLSRHC